MKHLNLVYEVLAYQSSHGGFSSTVELCESLIDDENCFITALVALELMEINMHTPHEQVKQAIEKALDFVAQCEETPNAGRFFFYPTLTGTPRLNIQLFPDLDDSALALLALLKGGRKQKTEVEKAIEEIFEPNRQLYINGTTPFWVRPGSFRTWIKPGSNGNPVDFCVNANVLALYAFLGRKDTEGCKAAISTLKNALYYSDLSISAMRRLAPFYAHPAELFFALNRAIEYGVTELDEVFALLLKKLDRVTTKHEILSEERAICCNDSGRPLWFAPALQKARQLSLLYQD